MPTSNHPASRAQRPLPTLLLSALILALGLPIPILAQIFSRVFVPAITLGSKTIKVGPNNSTKTISFGLLTGPVDAVIAASFISLISSVILIGALGIVRHVSMHNVWGWGLVVPAVANLLGQVGALAYVFIVHGQHKEAGSVEEVRFVDGRYDTNGTLYTTEAWACMMERFYASQEPWAKKSCSDLKTGRILTIPMTVCALVLAALSLWQVQRRGGFRWLLHGQGRMAMKSESIPL
ncbi:hypothetical protein BDV96DRAFT_102131 [Lophiotrema nucula]|uniref:Uncharacterized protein n=1 Tax=Lophiotrema nucula TaxID=690887 RepID=A0A6A5Z6J7_9PLEO|nr:hypothetical protein BDV96DRAFT_102131 [Lophiotrema nucula]